MSKKSGPYLFDVGVIALAHAETLVSESVLSYVRDAITGEIDAIVPHPALFGAHIVLTNYHRFSNAAASALMENFLEAKRIHWYERLPENVVREGFALARELNIGGWDGYYARVAIDGAHGRS